MGNFSHPALVIFCMNQTIKTDIGTVRAAIEASCLKKSKSKKCAKQLRIANPFRSVDYGTSVDLWSDILPMEYPSPHILLVI